MNKTVICAIFQRDFVSYFSNPTGYVFICVFVMLSSLAAFWPPEFFSNNLANLDQLSRWMPFILVVFVPAITMSIWAEERRQGTDELLLTLPASDFDVVLGKFKAGVAIFTVSLLFSMFSVWLIFAYGLGAPDPGLFVCTFLGYWLVGVSMLSVGMVASFLTHNLTVGFILGMLFNAPSALFGVADWVVKDPAWAEHIRQWSANEQFSDFARGVVTPAGLFYFLSVACVMLYICMILIGRRHWSGEESGPSLGGHYLLRALCLFIAMAGLSAALANYNLFRADMTTDQVNSLSPKTIELVKKLGQNEELSPVKVDLYVSPQVPSEYAAQKTELISTLKELSSISQGKVQFVQHEVENFSEEATLAEQTYGIEARPVDTKSRGARTRQEIFLGAAFTCGLDRVVVPFLDKGIPVEYELVRSISTVAQQKRQQVGILRTDAQLMGGFSMQGPRPEWRLIEELKKQYEVTEVDPSSPITKKFDVLLAVQPSSLSPEAMDHFVSAIRAGQPTAIFEDPFPRLAPGVVGTAQPKPPAGGMGMFGGGGPPPPKGDIHQLWNLIGLAMDGDQIVWEKHNPYATAESFVEDEWIFVDPDNGALEAFNSEDSISSGLKQALFFYAGGVRKANDAKIEFIPLATTGNRTGTISFRDMQQSGGVGLAPWRRRTGRSYHLAARATGTIAEDIDVQLDESVKDEDLLANDLELADDVDEEQSQSELTPLDVVVVGDIDCLSDAFFQIREMGDEEDALVDWRFQNVTFVLNILDTLAQDDRFIDIRKRTRDFRTLTKIEDATRDFRETALKEQTQYQKDEEEQRLAAEQEFRDKIAEIEARTDLDPIMKRQMLERDRLILARSRDVKVSALAKERDRKVRQNERELDAQVRGVQDSYKFLAVLVPPIPPVLLAFMVFFHRRQQEKEGVSKERLRYGAAPESNTDDA